MRGAAKEEMFCGTFLLYILRMRRRRVHGFINVLSESFLYLPLWLIFRQPHPNFINVRTAYASEIWAQLTKNLLTRSSTKRFREYIYDDIVFVISSLSIHYLFIIYSLSDGSQLFFAEIVSVGSTGSTDLAVSGVFAVS